MRIRVSELMNSSLLFLQCGQSIGEAARLFVENENIAALPVVDDEHQLLGFLSKKQLLVALAGGISSQDGIGSLLNREFKSLSSHDYLPLIIEEKFEYIPVINGGELVGMLYYEEVYHAIAERLYAQQLDMEASIDAVYNPVISIDNEYRIEIFNKAAAKLMGMSAQEVRGSDARKIFHGTGLLDSLLSGSPAPLRDVKVMDLHQENLAKAIGDKHRLLRGVAGSGKTLVLACRAKYLAQLNPDWRILVLCYNVSLAQSINQMIEDIDIHTKTPIEVDNFHNWAYRTWGMRDDALIEDLLTQIKNHDAPCPQYDAILIDEGQDFEPGWLRLIYAALNPDTHSFLLVEDRAQQIYYRKALSKELGISFQGRSKILTINYRNTEEIIKLGWDFYAHFSNGHNHRHKDDIMEVIPPQSAHRHGPEPVIRRFVNFDREADFIASEIRRLHDNEGIPYSDIAVLYRVRKFRDNYVDILRSAMASQQIAYYWVSESSTSKRRFRKKDDSVKISTVDSSKGLEFKVVFVCNVDNFPLALEEDIQRDVALLYIAITRAVERLYLTYSGKSVFTEYFEGVKNAAPAADG
jgi:CBS domain-containing protein